MWPTRSPVAMSMGSFSDWSSCRKACHGHDVDVGRRGLVECVLLIVGIGGYCVHRLGRRALRKAH
ncbi:hypothetical protein LL946_11085 [Knoellia locipacati]|uniref:hypothetical protein n=1 Tax=Knoellia locipacati TaxID=882824 RepID=UPI0038500F4E